MWRDHSDWFAKMPSAWARQFSAAPHIRLEQLRSVFTNIPVSFLSGAIANVMLAAAFSGSAHWLPLLLWTLASWVPVALMLALGKSFLALPDAQLQVDRYTRYLLMVFTVHGAIRGVLPWIAFENAFASELP